MNTAKRRIKIIAILLAAALLIGGITYFFFKPVYYRFFYLGDRIRGTVRVTVDGERYELKSSDVSAFFVEQKVDFSFQDGEDGTALSIHAGEYGPYWLTIRVDGLDAPLEAMFYQYNWYNVSKYDLDIAIDSASETITFTSTAQVLNEVGKFRSEERATTVSFSDESYHHCVVGN